MDGLTLALLLQKGSDELLDRIRVKSRDHGLSTSESRSRASTCATPDKAGEDFAKKAKKKAKKVVM